jgi:hypothetical protein
MSTIKRHCNSSGCSPVPIFFDILAWSAKAFAWERQGLLALVAQWIAHLASDQGVGGSNPSEGVTRKPQQHKETAPAIAVGVFRCPAVWANAGPTSWKSGKEDLQFVGRFPAQAG